MNKCRAVNLPLGINFCDVALLYDLFFSNNSAYDGGAGPIGFFIYLSQIYRKRASAAAYTVITVSSTLFFILIYRALTFSTSTHNFP